MSAPEFLEITFLSPSEEKGAGFWRCVDQALGPGSLPYKAKEFGSSFANEQQDIGLISAGNHSNFGWGCWASFSPRSVLVVIRALLTRSYNKCFGAGNTREWLGIPAPLVVQRTRAKPAETDDR